MQTLQESVYLARGWDWLRGVLRIFGNGAGGLRELESHPSSPLLCLLGFLCAQHPCLGAGGDVIS